MNMCIMCPQFTIITVTYNDMRGLVSTSDSIMTQVYHDLEWIVIDGNSIDGTKEFISKSLLISKWISEKDNGIYDAMNKGIKLARGKYIVFLNAGDAFPNESTLQNVFSHICECNKLPDIVLGGATFVLPNGIKLYRAPRDINKYIWHSVPANHQATYFSKSILENTFYDLEYKICGDYYLMAKMFIKGVNFSYLNVPLVLFKVGDTSYKKPISLCLESYLIKKKVLNLPLRTRIISFTKSIISTFGLIIVSQSYFTWLAKYVQKKRNGYVYTALV